MESDDLQYALIPYTTPTLHSEAVLVKAVADSLVPRPSMGRNFGRQLHPINMVNAAQLMFAVSTQQTCILTKRDATVGLGFETEEDRQKRSQKKELDQTLQAQALGEEKQKEKAPVKKALPPKADGEAPPAAAGAEGEDPVEEPAVSKVEEILDPLTECGFQSLINQVGEDYENTGNGYFEVVYDGDPGESEIVGLWHIPAAAVYEFWEKDDDGNFHYEVDNLDGGAGGVIKFARFGDTGMRARTKTTQERLSALVHFKMPTGQNPSYGVPQWIGNIVWLELAQQALQMEFDFYQNRAVPDLLAFLLGRKLPTKEFETFKTQLKETIGKGKRFRSLVINFSDPELKVQIERLQETTREKLAELWPTISMEIVSSHRVPALLAGIQTPGKMAAANELPNALVAFQTLYIAQHQRVFQAVLGKTLGSDEAGLGLKPTDFMLRRITDHYDMGQLDTMSRMRETATDAQLQGRKLEQGLKE